MVLWLRGRSVSWYTCLARRYGSLGTAGLLALFASGCTTLGPDFQTPEAPVAEQWVGSDKPEIKRDEVEYANWWKVFNDPVLDALIEDAYRQNLTLQISGLRIAEARANLGIAVGSLYPQRQETSGTVSGNRVSENAPNGGGANQQFFNYATGFDAAWELDFWGRFRRGVESADASLRSSIASYDDALVSLTAEVARAYVIIRTFQERIELARNNVKIQQRSLDIAKVRFNNGATTELDVTQATSLLRDTQSSIPQFQIGLRQAQNALSVLLGMPPRDMRDRLGESGKIPVAPADLAVGMPADLLRRRPDIRQAELQAAAQAALIGIAESDLYPRISLLGSIGLQTSSGASKTSNNADFDDLVSSDSITYGLGPSFQWPIFNYGRLKNNVRVQDARYQQLLVDYQNTVLSAAQEVEDGLVGYVRGREQTGFLAQSVAASQRSVQLALIQYRDGATDYQRVLDTQRALVGEQDRWTTTRGDVSLSLVATYKALGGGWEIRTAQEAIPETLRQEMAERTDWGKLLDSPELPESLDPPPPAREQPLFPSPDW